MKVSETNLTTVTFELDVYAETEPDFIDITDRVVDAVDQSGINNGFVSFFQTHNSSHNYSRTRTFTVRRPRKHLRADRAKER